MKVNHKKHGKFWVAKNPIAKHVRYAAKEQSERFPIAILTVESNHENAVGSPGGPVVNEQKCWESMRFTTSHGKIPSLRNGGGR